MRSIFLVLFALCLFAEDLPTSAQSSIAKYEAAMSKAQDAFDKAKLKELSSLAKSLEKIQADETRKGNLNAALAVKEKIDTLIYEGNTLADAMGFKLLTPEEQTKSFLVGEWMRGNRVWTFDKSGSFSDVFPNGLTVTGTWEIKEGTVLVTMSNGWLVEMVAPTAKVDTLNFITKSPAGDAAPGSLSRK